MKRALVVICLLLACQSAIPPIPENPRRIVSLKPNLTEMLFALGAGDRVVGVTTYCQWPPEAQTKTVIGNYADPDLETIFSLAPDLVMTVQEHHKPNDLRLIEKAKIPMTIYQTSSIQEIYQTFYRLGRILGTEKKAALIVKKIKDQFSGIALSREGKSEKVLFVVQRQPLIVVGTKTFLGEILKVAGFQNVVPQESISYPHISKEELLAWNPEIIIDIDPSPMQKNSYPMQYTNDRIFRFDPSLFLPGPRIAEATITLSKTVSHSSLQASHESSQP
jgi:iron complex transport system substrate-binding protein